MSRVKISPRLMKRKSERGSTAPPDQRRAPASRSRSPTGMTSSRVIIGRAPQAGRLNCLFSFNRSTCGLHDPAGDVAAIGGAATRARASRAAVGGGVVSLALRADLLRRLRWVDVFEAFHKRDRITKRRNRLLEIDRLLPGNLGQFPGEVSDFGLVQDAGRDIDASGDL